MAPHSDMFPVSDPDLSLAKGLTIKLLGYLVLITAVALSAFQIWQGITSTITGLCICVGYWY